MRHEQFTAGRERVTRRLARAIGTAGAVLTLLLVALADGRAQERPGDVGAGAPATTLAAPAAQGGGSLTGQWSVRGMTGDDLQFLFRHSGESTSTPIPLRDLRGVVDQRTGPDSTVRFEIVRDAGRVRGEGRLHAGSGTGTFWFAADQGYGKALRALGYPALTDAEAFRAAILDVDLEFVEDLHAEAVQAGSIDRLISLRIHRVTGEYVRALRALGYSAITPDLLTSMRIHGVTTAFITALRSAGYDSLSPEQLVSLRIHGVSPAFISELRAIGYHQIPVGDLVSLRVHRVTPADIRRMQIAGRQPPTIEDVIHAAIAR